MEELDKGIEPINPCIMQRVGEGSKDFRLHLEGRDDKAWRYPVLGLNKREYFSSMFLQAILSNPNKTDLSSEDMINSAVSFAEDLLNKLNE